MKRWIATLGVALLPIVATASDLVKIKVVGPVERHVVIELAANEATLSLALERAGGISASGSDHVHVLFGPSGSRRLKRLRGLEFYRGDCDYLLPGGAEVIALDCVGTGLGNLTKESYARLQREKTAYLRRRADGKVRIVPVAEASEPAK